MITKAYPVKYHYVVCFLKHSKRYLPIAHKNQLNKVILVHGVNPSQKCLSWGISFQRGFQYSIYHLFWHETLKTRGWKIMFLSNMSSPMLNWPSIEKKMSPQSTPLKSMIFPTIKPPRMPCLTTGQDVFLSITNKCPAPNVERPSPASQFLIPSDSSSRSCRNSRCDNGTYWCRVKLWEQGGIFPYFSYMFDFLKHDLKNLWDCLSCFCWFCLLYFDCVFFFVFVVDAFFFFLGTFWIVLDCVMLCIVLKCLACFLVVMFCVFCLNCWIVSF